MSTPYNFQSSTPTSSQDLKLDFHFITDNGHAYRFAFVPVAHVTSLLDPLPVVSGAIQVALELLKEGHHQSIDPRLPATVIEMCRCYLAHAGQNRIFVFHCASYDGKQWKRFLKFDRWFNCFAKALDFEKVDRKFFEPSENGYHENYISFLFSARHPYHGKILLELDYLEEEFCSMK